ncbi:MAG TPA: sugar phosphate isomerase/epimerase, partial [Amaricoccus sp.]|nr:sugar phosphate isomerase/epimerase [Amaricoccus sp.]
MRDLGQNLSAVALNTATLGHNVEGAGAGWSPERTIDACAARGLGGIVFWRREIGARAVEIGERARAAGVAVAGLCRTPFLVGPMAPPGRAAVMDDFRASIDMAAGLAAPVLTIVTGGVEPGTKGVAESLRLVADRV